MPWVRESSREWVDQEMADIINKVNNFKGNKRALLSYIILGMLLRTTNSYSMGTGLNIDDVFDIKAVMTQTLDEFNKRFSEPMEALIIAKDFFDPSHERLK